MLSTQDVSLASSTLSLSPIKNNAILFSQTEVKALNKLNDIKSSFYPTRFWLHIDLPYFFEAIEERNNPLLINKEYIIESSNHVQGFNRHKCLNLNLNQSLKEAKLLYENIEIIKCNYSLYLEDTKKITRLLMTYDKNVQRVDWSEFYLDLTFFIEDNYASSSNEEIYDIVKEIKGKLIEQMSKKENKSNKKQSIPLGIGLGANKVIARLASIQSLKENNKLIIIPNDKREIKLFISDIAISSIPFISERTKTQLKDLEINTCKDILTKYVELYYVFEKKYSSLISFALGIGPDVHDEIKDAKPISFSQNITEQSKIDQIFISLVKQVANEMKESKCKGKTLTIEVVDDCKNKTKRSLTLAKKFESEKEIKINGEKLLNDLINKVKKITLLRIRMTTLVKENDTNDNIMNDWLKHKQSNKNINVIKFSNNNSSNKGLKSFITKGENKSVFEKKRAQSSHLSLFKNTINQQVKLKTPKRSKQQKKMKSKFTLDTFLITK